IQDAVATANLLWRPLRDGTLKTFDLARVQQRRIFPTRVTQRLQVAAQNRIVQPVLSSTTQFQAPWPLRVLSSAPWLQRVPARVVGVGFRPEHVRSPELPVSR